MGDVMIIKEFEYLGYYVEIHEHPIYHDWEWVVKSLDKLSVIGASTHPYFSPADAENSAIIFINNQ